MKMFLDELERIKKSGLYRQMKYLQSPQQPYVKIEGKDYLMLSSNSYLGLCNDPRLKQAAREAIEEYGIGSGGSRLTTGSYEVHKKLENEIAAFKGTQAALLFNTGYMANIGAISSIAGKDWVIFSDRFNHASIIDGCRLSGAEIVVYEHCDAADLEKKAHSRRGKRALIVTDGLFSVDGDVAPLPEIVQVAKKYNMLLMVDDAHATGVLGENGGGTADYFSLQNEIDIQMGTLSKALASEGGFIAGNRDLIDYLANKARSFIFSTALSPATVAVSLKALEIVQAQPCLRQSVMSNSVWFRKRLKEAGFHIMDFPTQIISIVLGQPELTVNFSNRLMEKNIFVSAIRPPTVPQGTGRLRINMMATHTIDDLARAIDSITFVGKEIGILKDTENTLKVNC
ncbi:MAG TPA: 8-amino-7-oxononanoate synthase [Smithella sp.]|nr:8-amino-7-oxononanoate synthase [Smithella sp.]